MKQVETLRHKYVTKIAVDFKETTIALTTPGGRNPFHPRATLAGSNLSSTLAITKGWCSPALPTSV